MEYKYQPMSLWDGIWDDDGPILDTIEEAIEWIDAIGIGSLSWEIRVIWRD